MSDIDFMHVAAAAAVLVIAGIVGYAYVSSSSTSSSSVTPLEVEPRTISKTNGTTASSRSMVIEPTPLMESSSRKKKKKKKRNRKKKSSKAKAPEDSDDSDDDDDIDSTPAEVSKVQDQKEPAKSSLPASAVAPLLVSSSMDDDNDDDGEWTTKKTKRKVVAPVSESVEEVVDEDDADEKEDGEEEEEEEEEVDTSVTVVIKHPSDKVMRCIGKGGATIKEIEAKSKCIIDLSVDEGKITITGEQEDVDECIVLCKNAMYGESQDEIKLYNRGMVNIVFGKDFATIRNIQEESGARLDIPRGDTTLQLSGSKEAVEKARVMVTELIDKNKGIQMAFDNARVGAVYGKGGTNIRSIQDRTDTFVEVHRGTSTATANIMGPPEGVQKARELIQKAVDGEIELKEGEILEEMELGNATSQVVGKGGSKVKELEKKFSVVINVSSDDNNCKIIGPKAKVLKCKEAINDLARPIWETEKAIEEANKAAAVGQSPWQQSGIPSPDDAEGW